MKFLCAFAVSVGAITLLYGAFVRVLDPRGDFSTGLFPPLVLESRKVKTALFDDYNAEKPVEGLLLGSSRCFKFRPREIEAVFGRRFFNFAVGGANTEDYLAVYRWVRSRGVVPKIVLIGHDPTDLHDQDIPHPAFAQNEIFNLALAESRGPFASLALYKSALSLPYLADGMRSLLLVLDPSRRKDPGFAFEADGYIREPKIERARTQGTFDVSRVIDDCLEDTVAGFDMVTLSERRKELLEIVDAKLKAAGDEATFELL